MVKKTPLYDKHIEAGGKPVEFAGYLLPIQYSTGILAEHQRVREACGMFDVSHMGELLLSGPDALFNIQMLLTNSFVKMKAGQIRYSPMCNKSGGVVDDLLVYKKAENDYLLVVNATNREKDARWIRDHLSGETTLIDASDDTAQIALQGPDAQRILAQAADPFLLPQRYYTFTDRLDVGGMPCLVSRTGYTAEDGFEIYCENKYAAPLWDLFKSMGALPCALGCRDTLRLEGGMPLYGHEMDEGVTPFEAGLGAFVKMDKHDFIGKQALLARGAPKLLRVGLRIIDRGIAREGAEVFSGEEKIGHVTSGTHSPTLKYAIAMARVGTAHANPGEEVSVDVRGKRLKAEIVPLPFYKRAR